MGLSDRRTSQILTCRLGKASRVSIPDQECPFTLPKRKRNHQKFDEQWGIDTLEIWIGEKRMT